MQSAAAKSRSSKPKVSLWERQKMKNLDGEYISRIVRFSSDSRLVQAVADRIWVCAQKENLYVADDLHTDYGELFSGRGQFWGCNSRLCPSCTGKLSKRNRGTARFVIENEKLYWGEHWYFLTLTMPDLSLMDLPLLTCRKVINDAWRKFSRSKWFKTVSRGGIKSEEFTVGEHQQYHYHLHLLAICRIRIQSNSYQEIRHEWTGALERSFKENNLDFKCNTSDGLAVCHVQKVWNIERSISELCKYITKTTDWAKIPASQLADIATVARFPRMFEVYGVCKERAKEIRPQKGRDGEEQDTYLDTKNLSDKKPNDAETIIEDGDAEITDNDRDDRSQHPPPKKPTWRELCRILPRKDWLDHLDKEVSKVQEWRKKQLREKYAHATFKTLDGQGF